MGFLIFNLALLVCFNVFLFTSLSKVHLKVKYRDWHTAVLFGAISNMLASLKRKKEKEKKKRQTTFQHFFKVTRKIPLSDLC